jgi:CRISPR/Cas system-associated endonuclease Cas1
MEKFKFKLIDRSIFNLIDDQSSHYDFYKAIGIVKEKPGLVDKLSLKYHFMRYIC